MDANFGNDSRRHKLDRIAQQVGHALGQVSFVSEHPRERPFHDDAGLGRLKLRMIGQNSFNEPLQVHWVQRRLALSHTAVSEHVLDEQIQPLGCAGNCLQVLNSLGVKPVFVVFQQRLGVALHSPQRGAHVMGDAVGEGFQFVDGLLQLGGALGHQPFQLARPVGQLRLRAAQ